MRNAFGKLETMLEMLEKLKKHTHKIVYTLLAGMTGLLIFYGTITRSCHKERDYTTEKVEKVYECVNEKIPKSFYEDFGAAAERIIKEIKGEYKNIQKCPKGSKIIVEEHESFFGIHVIIPEKWNLYFNLKK